MKRIYAIFKLLFLLQLFLFIITNSLYSSEIEKSYFVNKIDKNGGVHFNMTMNCPLRAKNCLLNSYPVMLYTAEIPANTSNLFPIIASQSDVLWEIKGPTISFGLSRSRKVSFGIYSCNGSDIFIWDGNEIEKISNKYGSVLPKSDIKKALTVLKGNYVLSIPYGYKDKILNLIEIHSSKKDKIIIYANVYDPVETTSRYFLDKVATSIFGSSYSNFKSIKSLLSSLSGNTKASFITNEAEKRAISKCKSELGNSYSSELICKNISDSIIKFETIGLLLEQLCESSY